MSNGKKHDVIFVCTMSNNIFPFDADSGARIWAQPSFLGQPFLPGWNDAVDSKHINRSFGILSTPVIEGESGIMYAVDWDTNDPGHQDRSLHVNAIRIADGKPVPGKPQLLIAASVKNAAGQTVSLSQVQHVNRVPTDAAAWTSAPWEAQYLKLFDVTPGAPSGK